MTARQQLLKVDLPLAFPVIIAGIRTSAVWVVGTATLATPVGAASLGNYIFAGLQTRNVTAVLFGCFFAAALAIVLDQILGLIETGIAKRQRGRVNVAVAGLATVFIVGLAPVAFDREPASSFSSRELSADSVTEQAPLNELSVVIGSKAFTEQYILSDLLADYLRSYGIAVSTRQGLGSTVLFDALSNSSIDLYVEYTGTIWSAILKQPDFPDRRELQLRTEQKILADYGILSMGRLGFENAYALAMRRTQADALGIVTLFDLAAHSADLRFAGDDEFFAREEWRRVRDAYGLRPAEQRVMDPSFFYEAIGNGTVDVISAYTSDGRIDAYELRVVDDPLGAFPPYDAVLLLSPNASRHRELKRALSRLVNRIDQAAMRHANRRVDVDGQSPAAAASDLLESAF